MCFALTVSPVVCVCVCVFHKTHMVQVHRAISDINLIKRSRPPPEPGSHAAWVAASDAVEMLMKRKPVQLFKLQQRE